MPNPEKVLKALTERNLTLTVKQDESELLKIETKNKNIDMIIKNTDELKKLVKEILK
jgi:hypothetical protein